jgi:hypothetical protein
MKPKRFKYMGIIECSYLVRIPSNADSGIHSLVKRAQEKYSKQNVSHILNIKTHVLHTQMGSQLKVLLHLQGEVLKEIHEEPNGEKYPIGEQGEEPKSK